MKIAKKIIELLQLPRGLFHIYLMKISKSRTVIIKDIQRWLQETGLFEQTIIPEWKGLVLLLWKCPAFRNLFYYRIVRENRVTSRALMELAKILYRPMDSLFIITPEIGPGLYIQHGFSTIISAKSIGKNCWINQQVTIGYSNQTDTPIIGDGVRITAGAKVFGNITLGDNSIIGANAVVIKNVPPNCTVVGIPAYIVKCEGEKVRRSL